MNALLIVLGATVLLWLAYRTYGRMLAKCVFPLDDSLPTPAHTMRDDRDYMPTPPVVLFGHHFASIAGLGPLLGPAIAVIWGWVPALLWILLGCILIGAVHHLGCLYSSVRNHGRTVADIAYDVAGSRARVLFLLFGIFAIGLAMGAILWQLFGASNQLLAALSLLVVSLYLRSLGRPTVYTLLPMAFMLVVTISALILGMLGFWAQGNWLLFGFSGLILLLALWLVGEAFVAWQQGSKVLTRAESPNRGK